MTKRLAAPAEVRAVETLADGWQPLRRVTFDLRRRDGRAQRQDREVLFTRAGAAVLPFDPLRTTVLLTRQFRLPPHLNGEDPYLVEACAGRIEDGDNAAGAVLKEAEQEIGYRLDELRQIFTLYMSPSFSVQKMHLFVANYSPERRNGAGGGVQAEGEDVEVVELPLAEAWRMVEAGVIVDAKTVVLLQHLVLAQQRASSAPRTP